MKDLTDKTAIVTGATRGIGKAIVLSILPLGYRVVGIYKTSDQLAAKLKEKFQNLTLLKANVGEEAEVIKVIQTTIKKYKSLDLVINNAGIDIGGKIENYSLQNWEKMISVNLRSVFLFSKYSIPYLRKSKDGHIINIASRLGFIEYAEPKYVVYSAAKAGVINFTIGLSKELYNTGIRVNAVIPTSTKTDLLDVVYTPEEQAILKKKGKLGDPEDAANLILQLITDKSANGKILIDKRIHL